MAGTAVSRRLIWRVATLVGARMETPTARTLVLQVPDWPGHQPGQHVDVRLTAPDGYSTQRSYSIASAWTAQTSPVLLLGGGSGVVPLMTMIRARGAVRGRQPFRLIYSVRTPQDALFADELARRVRDDPGLDVRYVYTRKTPEAWPDPPRRIGVATVNTYGWPPEFEPDCFVCGPTSFVETAADILVALGHDSQKIKTERFGGTS